MSRGVRRWYTPGNVQPTWRRRTARPRGNGEKQDGRKIARRCTGSCGSTCSSRSSLGIAFGLLFEEAALKAQWLADAFIQLIKAVAGPVIFVTVVIGIASLGDMARAGGLPLRALGYFLGMTVVALGLGLLAGDLVKPGSGFEGDVSDSAKSGRRRSRSARQAATRGSALPFITDDLLPSSFVSPFVENEILRVLVLADPHRGRRLRAPRRCSASRSWASSTSPARSSSGSSG